MHNKNTKNSNTAHVRQQTEILSLVKIDGMSSYLHTNVNSVSK